MFQFDQVRTAYKCERKYSQRYYYAGDNVPGGQISGFRFILAQYNTAGENANRRKGQRHRAWIMRLEKKTKKHAHN